jgi:mono/diheme cytochrome c family protein
MNLRYALLASLLGLACGPGAVMWAAADPLPTVPTWVIDPAAPGENLPPIGRSLFDQLFAVARHGQAATVLPFPFEALLASLDAQLARDPASPLPPAKRVLIPLGRSLQRTAAAPDYFVYPRVVVAVDSEPALPTAPFLKDRLYIGYQEKSAILEVISYNETAGRFEFQLVKDYRAGGKPQVVYANRSLCFACHQNGAPIFPRALWDETNANPQAAALLAASGRRFHGIPLERGVDIPYAIDNATERANGFALTQRLWREGCGGSDAIARRCRAGLFAAALRHALSAGQVWMPDAAFEQSVAAPLRAEARRRWPGGLAVGNPDLPNRNPLQNLADWPPDRAARIARSHVPARFEPLVPRPPREIWQAEAPGALGLLVAGLAEFVASPERRRLEAALARQRDIVTARLTVPCRIGANTPASRWSVQCAPPPGQAGPTLTGNLSITAGHPSGGRLQRLTVPGGTALSSLELVLTGRTTAHGASFIPRIEGRLPRTAAGDSIGGLEFRRNADDPAAGEVVLDIRQEFAAIERAMSSLAERTQGDPLFGPEAIPREPLLTALFAQLGAPTVPPCCRVALALPVPRLEVPAVAPASPAIALAEPGLRAFYPYCATCHQTAETFPPNFLAGSGAEVAARLRQCAPRLYVRLAMADLAPEHRDKTPMPPESLLPAFATDSAGWRASPARAALLVQVGDWLRAESGRAPNLAQLLAGGYEALRPCLPAP